MEILNVNLLDGPPVVNTAPAPLFPEITALEIICGLPAQTFAQNMADADGP